MIRKILAFATVLVLLSTSCFVSAGTDDTVVKGATLSTLVEFALADEMGGHQMRGFTASKDGKYLYGGFIQQYRHVSKYNAADGSFIAEYVPEMSNDDIGSDNNYPKGIATDNRGYLFVGITHPNTPYISLACVDGNMEEVSVVTEKITQTGVTGINGIATQKIGDKILCWVLTCYDCDQIRCYDVTDVNNIVLYEDFGVDGIINYNELTGSQADPGYLGVDTEGVIYLAYLQDGASYSKGSHICKIAADGKSIQLQAEIPEAYGVCTAGDYVFVSTHAKADSCVYVLNKSDLTTVTTLKNELQADDMSGIFYAGEYLYVGDQGNSTMGIAGTIHRTSLMRLTRSAAELEVVETEALETREPPQTTVEVSSPVTDADDETDAVSTSRPAGSTSAVTSAVTQSPEPGEDKPISTKSIIFIAVGAVIIIGVVVFFAVKKKKISTSDRT